MKGREIFRAALEIEEIIQRKPKIMMRVKKQSYLIVLLLVLTCGYVQAEDTLPALKDGFVPSTVEEAWMGFDPRKEPLDVDGG